MSFNDCLNAFMLGQRLRPGLVGVGGQKEPVAYLYNGVRLPKLPESELPYAFLRLDGYTGHYWLWYSDTAPYTGTGFMKGMLLWPESDVHAYCWLMYEGETEWGHFDNDAEDDLTGSPFWANFDVLDADGNVYLAASDPIPVYE